MHGHDHFINLELNFLLPRSNVSGGEGGNARKDAELALVAECAIGGTIVAASVAHHHVESISSKIFSVKYFRVIYVIS